MSDTVRAGERELIEGREHQYEPGTTCWCGQANHILEHETISKAQLAESTASTFEEWWDENGIDYVPAGELGRPTAKELAQAGWQSRGVSEYERGRLDGRLTVEQVKACLPCSSSTQSDNEWWNVVTANLNHALAATSGTPAEHNPARAPHNKFASLWCDACPRPTSGRPAPLSMEQCRTLAFELRDKDLLRSYASDIPDITVERWAKRIYDAQAAAPGGKEPEVSAGGRTYNVIGCSGEGDHCVCMEGYGHKKYAQTPIPVPLADKSKEELVRIVEMMTEDLNWYVGERNRLIAASHPLQDKPPRVPRKCQRCGADLPGSSSFSVCGGDCRKPQEQPPAAPRFGALKAKRDYPQHWDVATCISADLEEQSLVKIGLEGVRAQEIVRLWLAAQEKP